MRLIRTKKTAVLAALGIGALAAGGTGFAHAAVTDNAPPDASSSGVEQQDPSYTGSVKAPPEAGGTGTNGTEASDTPQSEANEAAVLQGLAKITPDQAKAAAAKAANGTATTATLGNENGYVVYEVKVDNQEVKVDAGNGNVLAQETDTPEAGDTPDAPGAGG